jgi:hypothetical protein
MTSPRNRRAARAATGLASLLTLAALIAGLPAALYAVGGSPIPHAIPSWHQIIVTLSRPDHGALLLAAIRWVSWAAWAAFTISALVEVFSQARGRPAPRLPVITPVQGFAAALVGTAVLGLLPGPHLPRPVPPLSRSAQAIATAPPRPGQPVWAAPTTAAGTLQVSARPGRIADRPVVQHRELYHVVEGDNLWEIAAHRLGDGERWHEIYALNRGKPQPGGGSLTDPSLIYPGWVLALPSRSATPAGHAPHRPATSRQPPPSTGHPPARHATRPGPPNGRETGHPQVPGHAHTPHAARPATPHPGRRERPPGIHLPGGGLVGITLAAAISTALVAWRLQRRRSAVPRWPIPGERAEPPVPEAISTLRRAHLRSLAADAAESRGEPWPDEDNSGEAGPPGDGEAEDGEGLDEFGAPASPAAWQPATPAPGNGKRRSAPLPPASTTVAGGAAAGPLPAPVPSPAPAPVIDAGPGPGAAGQPAGEAGWQPAPPARPLPAGTVVFGTRGSTEIPLAEVARQGLGLTGPGAHAAARALMIGLLAAPSPGNRLPGGQVVIPAADARQLTEDQVAAQVPGVTPGLPDGLTVSPALAAALDLIETEITRRLRLLETGHDTAASPGTPRADEAGLAPLALIATVDPPSAPRARAALDAGASAGVTGILLGDWPAGATCHIGADGVVLAATDASLAGVQACHLPAADTAAMLSLLRGAQGHLIQNEPGPAQPPAPGPGAALEPEPDRAPRQSAGGDASTGSSKDSVREDVTGQRPDGQQPGPQRPHHDLAQPVPGSPGTPPAGGSPARHSDTAAPSQVPAAITPTTATTPATGRPVAIRVLGPLRITTTGGAEIRGGLRKARELLAYLAVHPDGATGEGISADLWPESSPRYAASQRKLALRRAREMLRTATGLPAPLFIILAGERYRLDPALIEVDLWQFDAALGRAQAAAGQDQLTALQQAAALYQGPLADGAGYEWAEHHAEPARRRAVDALARIAGILQPGDPEHALTVLEAVLGDGDGLPSPRHEPRTHALPVSGRPGCR